MHNDFHSDQVIAGLKIALEQPAKIRFLKEDLALFSTDECVYKVEKMYEEWWCNCQTFQTMRQYHREPICLHTVAVGRIVRGVYENMFWLHQACENFSTVLREQPIGEMCGLDDEMQGVVSHLISLPSLQREILRA